MNSRRPEDAAQAPRDTLLTPTWAWEWLFDRWEPMRGSTLVDPATAGFAGWTAGGRLAALRDRPVVLADLEPLADRCRFSGAPIQRADFFSLPLPAGPRTLLTNGPFKHYKRWLAHARRHFDEIVLLCRVGFIFAAGGDRVRHLHSYLGPAKRMAFELLPEEAERRRAFNAAHAKAIAQGKLKPLEVNADPATLTGWRCNPTGVDHGFAVWRRGYDAPAVIVVEGASGVEGAQLSLLRTFGGRRITTDLRMDWREAA